MSVNILKGRLGHHRFHPILVHFPSALYPFSLVMDFIHVWTSDESFRLAGLYALEGAIAMSAIAMIYGAIDFLQIDPKSKPWKTAGLHALLNLSWLVGYVILLFYRLKYEHIGWTYIAIMTGIVFGLFFSNYLGAELIVRYKIGIKSEPDKV